MPPAGAGTCRGGAARRRRGTPLRWTAAPREDDRARGGDPETKGARQNYAVQTLCMGSIKWTSRSAGWGWCEPLSPIDKTIRHPGSKVSKMSDPGLPPPVIPTADQNPVPEQLRDVPATRRTERPTYRFPPPMRGGPIEACL